MNFNSPYRLVARIIVFAAVVLSLVSPLLFAQTVGTGSIVGVVTDPQGAVVTGAKVGITNKATAAVIHVTTSSAGSYTSGPIVPGDYVVRIEAKGFKTSTLPLVVQVGNTVSGNVKMQIGQESQVVEVQGNAVVVNTEQATVQGVLSLNQIENLPVNGRNFLDLAQLEPGVQIQEGSTFDPTKNGFSSISFQGRFGRTARIEVDGVDVSDETVGTTTQNIPASAIQEFQLSQSSLDLSTELTSSGAVNVTTRSGSNQPHGEAFGYFRDNKLAAALPGLTPPPFQREQFGANVGGALVKDKAFFFLDAERTKQDLTAAEPFSPPFDQLNTTLSQPYREFDTDGRLDWNVKGNTRAFYRFNFFQNSDLRPNGSASSTQRFRNTDNTVSHTIGIDFNKGSYSHSIRLEYLKFRNGIGDATSGLASVDNPIPGLGINIGASVSGNCVFTGGGAYCGGPNWLAPQATIQSNHEAKYDGSKMLGKHIIRYGVTYNRLVGGGFAAFSQFPQVGTTSAGTSSDPTSYTADYVGLGNGAGFPTAKGAFGFPAGELGPDNRLEMYVGDSWKIIPRLTVMFGLHYVRDTGRTDSNLGPLPELNQWGPGYGNQIRNPNLNFAPQAGFAWDVGGNGKTVVRGGGGLFYENSIWNNILFDSPARLRQGIFANTPEVCSGGVAAPFVWPTSLAVGTSIAGGAATIVNTSTGPQAQPNFCGGIISTVAPQILGLSSAYQAATASVTGLQPNSNFVGSTLTALNSSYVLFFPGYRTPRSWQMNFGIQKEIRPGTLLTIDYVRNIGEHYLIAQDINHSGAARSFNQANAVAARDAAQASAGKLIGGGFTPCSSGINQATCVINANATLVTVNGTPTPTCVGGGPPPCSSSLGVSGAQAQYSSNGLDSNLQAVGGGPCSFCAFPGTNPLTTNSGAVGGVDMLFPVGRSVYSGLQMKLVHRIDKPTRYVKGANFQVSYSYSKFISQVQDQDFINLATDNDNPTRFTGPSALDRKHQLSFGGTFDLPFHTKLSAIGHFYSPLAQTLQLPELTSGGEIFATDWLGAGLGASAAPEPLPGTQIGQFQRGTNIGNLQSVINNYNHTYSGQLTPAGECLVGNHQLCPGLVSSNSQVMTGTDMGALGWVMPQLGSVPPGALGIPWLKSMDLKASWPIKVKERVIVEPSASVFNVFNFANAFLPGNLPGASLVPGSGAYLAPNVVGGVTRGSSLTPFRASFQSGTYALGAPRQFEFGLRISF
ncbi:MAG TPA: TonB-dependent receptor [Candidatus Acidoferrum sp.]|nr:TonB-dependent receptor [Candidatus Acidoferrum sp.]